MPLVNAFLQKKDIPKERRFDLSVGFCPKCYLVQLIKTVDPKKLFRHYLYFSSATKTIVEHSKQTAEHLIDRLHLSKKSTVLEIGSNDGVQLQFYKDAGIGIVGVDPAKNIAKIANTKGILTIPAFFNLRLAKTLVQKRHMQADMVYGANVFAHVPAIVDFVRAVSEVLKPKGTAIFEFPYLGGLLENKFDTIYHEHVFYYSLLAVQNLLVQASLEVYDVETIPMQGGSLRVFICHKGEFPVCPKVLKLEKEELRKKYNSLSSYRVLNENVQKLRRNLITLLKNLTMKGYHIAAYGAPAKGIILLNYFNIQKYLDFIVDKSVVKQGLYAPGVHMKIFP